MTLETALKATRLLEIIEMLRCCVEEVQRCDIFRDAQVDKELIALLEEKISNNEKELEAL